MAKIPEYEREIRGPDGVVYVEDYVSDFGTETAGQFFKSRTYRLILNGEEVGRDHEHYESMLDKVTSCQNTMPAWWSAPSDPTGIGIEYSKNGRKLLPVKPNAVTVAPYMANGRLQLQQRGFVSPKGLPVVEPGLLSLNGGNMKSGNIEMELRREAQGELGINIGKHFAKVGDLYDPDAGRINHVFRLTSGYDTLLVENMSVGVVEAVGCLTNPEGLGRAYVWRGDLEAIIAAKMLTGISMRILAAFPDLLPPPRPKA